MIRGRAWIALIAFALIGIVTLQLLVLALNANIGRTLVREARLQRENAALGREGSELAAGERVETQAARLGMELVPISSLRFLTSDPPVDIARAASALNAPVHAAGGSVAGATSVGAPAQEAGGAAPTSSAVSAQQAAGASSASGEAGTAGAATTAAATTVPASATTVPASATTVPASAQESTQAQAAPTSVETSAAPAAGVGGGEGTPASSAGGVGAPGAPGVSQSPGQG